MHVFFLTACGVSMCEQVEKATKLCGPTHVASRCHNVSPSSSTATTLPTIPALSPQMFSAPRPRRSTVSTRVAISSTETNGLWHDTRTAEVAWPHSWEDPADTTLAECAGESCHAQPCLQVVPLHTVPLFDGQLPPFQAWLRASTCALML